MYKSIIFGVFMFMFAFPAFAMKSGGGHSLSDKAYSQLSSAESQLDMIEDVLDSAEDRVKAQGGPSNIDDMDDRVDKALDRLEDYLEAQGCKYKSCVVDSVQFNDLLSKVRLERDNFASEVEKSKYLEAGEKSRIHEMLKVFNVALDGIQ